MQNLNSELMETVRAKYAEYASYSTRWSAGYWGFVFGAAILSALSGILLKLDALEKQTILALSQTDIAALLAGTAALLITISSAGDFSGKWKANRTAKNRTEQLLNDLRIPEITSKEVIARLNKIIDDQNNGVINNTTKNRVEEEG